MLYIDKCVGDRNLGQHTILDYVYRKEEYGSDPVAELQGPVYFHGYRILKATLRYIHDLPESKPYSQVTFMTSSNGSNGLYLYIDRLADYVRSLEPKADVRGMPNSMIRSSLEVEATVDAAGLADYTKVYDNLGKHGTLAFHLNMPDDSPGNGYWATSLVYQEGLEYWRNVSWGAIDPADPTVDASCLAAHPSEPHVCLDQMHVLLNHVSTPLFIVAQQQDSAVRQGSQHRFTTRWDLEGPDCHPDAQCCHDEAYDEGYNCKTYPDGPFWYAQTAGYSKEAFPDRIVATMRALHEGLAKYSEMRPDCSDGPCDNSKLPSPGHAAFIDDHGDHGGTTNTWKALSQINGISLEDHFAAWLENDTDAFCVDVSGEHELHKGVAASWAPCPSP